MDHQHDVVDEVVVVTEHHIPILWEAIEVHAENRLSQGKNVRCQSQHISGLDLWHPVALSHRRWDLMKNSHLNSKRSLGKVGGGSLFDLVALWHR